MTCKFLNFALAGYVIATSAVQAANGSSSELWVGIRLSGWTQLITRGQGCSNSKRQDEDTSDGNWPGMRSWELNSEAGSWAAILQSLAQEAAWSSFYSAWLTHEKWFHRLLASWHFTLPCCWFFCFSLRLYTGVWGGGICVPSCRLVCSGLLVYITLSSFSPDHVWGPSSSFHRMFRVRFCLTVALVVLWWEPSRVRR